MIAVSLPTRCVQGSAWFIFVTKGTAVLMAFTPRLDAVEPPLLTISLDEQIGCGRTIAWMNDMDREKTTKKGWGSIGAMQTEIRDDYDFLRCGGVPFFKHISATTGVIQLLSGLPASCSPHLHDAINLRSSGALWAEICLVEQIRRYSTGGTNGIAVFVFSD